ncbi:hypothetical protein NKH36_16625 [Mesorhizobium sp. M1312]|uniref:hypothetical protein n=1 Tax=unclassified Mesorhizobium TaxID=325217 RepID=UPI00333AABD4
MKFVLTKEYRYWWPVKIERPDPVNPGKWQVQSYMHEFVGVSEDEAKALNKEIEALSTAEDKRAHEHDLLIKASRNWRDVIDDDKNPVEFSEELLRQALQDTWYRVGLYNAYASSLASPAARKGN